MGVTVTGGDEAKAQELSIPVVGEAGDMFLWFGLSIPRPPHSRSCVYGEERGVFDCRHMGTLHRSGANVMPPGTPPRVAFNSEHSNGLPVTTLSSHLVVAGGFSARWFNNFVQQW